MKRITINIGTHGVQTTAAEMRRRLAQALSKIPGDQIVFFNLTLHLENYQPAGNSITKIPDSPTTRHAVAKYSTYCIGHNDFAVQSLNRVQMETRDVLNPTPDGNTLFDDAVFGELGRPEND